MTKIVSMSFFSPSKLGFLLFALIFNISLANRQKLNHVLGEFIVEVDQNRDLEQVRKKLISVEKRFTQFKSKQIMKKKNIYIITIIVLVVISILLKENFFFFSIYDNYYVIPYYTITTLIATIFTLILLIKLVIRKTKKQ